MSFTSVTFLIFILVTVILYYIIPKKFQWVLLLVASYVFYMSAGVKLLVFLLSTTLTTYLAGILMGRQDKLCRGQIDEMDGNNRKWVIEKNRVKKKGIVTATILFNFAILLNMSSYNLFLLLNNSSVYKKVAEFLICSSAIFWKDY